MAQVATLVTYRMDVKEGIEMIYMLTYKELFHVKSAHAACFSGITFVVLDIHANCIHIICIHACKYITNPGIKLLM